MINRLSKDNERMILPTKDSNVTPIKTYTSTHASSQIAPTHRLIQSKDVKSSTTIADAISAAEKNGSTKSDDSGSLKSEKNRRFTEQEDSFIWDTYAAYTSNRSLEEAGFSVPDGVVLELSQKLNTNTQKLQARLRELKAAHFQKSQDARHQKWKQDAAKTMEGSLQKDRSDDKRHSQHTVASPPAEPKTVADVLQRERRESKHLASSPPTPTVAPTPVPAVRPTAPSPTKLRHGEYTDEEDKQLWSAYEKNIFQFLDTDQFRTLGASLERRTDSLDRRLRQLIEAQSGVPADEIETVEFTPVEDIIIRDTFAKQVAALLPNSSEHDRDLLEIQVAEEVAAQLGKFYGRVWYRLQWLKEHNPVDKPAAAVPPPVPAVPAPFPSYVQRAASSQSSVSPGTVRSTSVSRSVHTKDISRLVGNKNRRDVEPPSRGPNVGTRSVPPVHSSGPAHRDTGAAGFAGVVHAKAAADEEPDSGEVSSDADDGTLSTYSTRSEGSDYKSKSRSKNAAKQPLKAATTAPANAANIRHRSGEHNSEESEPDSSLGERTARRASRAKALRSGRYTEEEDIEIWIAFTSAEGESPAKLGKTLAKAARKINRTYNSVAGRLERLLVQQKDAEGQYQPGMTEEVGVDDGADAAEAAVMLPAQDAPSDDTAHSEDELLAAPTTMLRQTGTVLAVANGDGGEQAVKKQRVRAREFF